MSFLTLESPIKWIFIVHIIGGAIALAIFIVPLLSKKGGSIHVKTGWVYSFAMGAVTLTAFIITPWRMFFDPEKTSQSQLFSIFLFYISFFTVAMLLHGILVLKFKNRKIPLKSFTYLALPILTVLLGVSVQWIGYRADHTLLMIFPLLGHGAAIAQLRYWLTTPKLKMHWWYEHMNSMFGACIATITAFLVTAIPRIIPGSTENIFLWITPGIVLGTISNRWIASYKAKYEHGN